MKSLLMVATLLSLTIANSAHSYDTYVNVGVWTEHYLFDCSCYNENNELVQVTVNNGEGLIFSASTFVNSHYVRSYSAGIGTTRTLTSISNDLVAGGSLAIIHGYGDEIDMGLGEYLIAPIVYIKYHYFKVNVLATVVNIGIEVKL